MTWKADLASWQSTDFAHCNEQDMLDFTCYQMGQKYPGNYELDWKYDTIVGRFMLYPKFDSHEDELWFLLKYS